VKSLRKLTVTNVKRKIEMKYGQIEFSVEMIDIAFSAVVDSWMKTLERES
jgi:hypothetical protein